jgi:hypothetical protein
MVKFAWSDDPEVYEGGGVAVYRVFLAGEVDKNEHPGSPDWVFRLGLYHNSRYKKHIVYTFLF